MTHYLKAQGFLYNLSRIFNSYLNSQTSLLQLFENSSCVLEQPDFHTRTETEQQEGEEQDSNEVIWTILLLGLSHSGKLLYKIDLLCQLKLRMESFRI